MKITYLEKFIRLMAEENLSVIRGQYDTASIDPVNRIIRIPAFATDNDHIAVLMSAHEVSHALNTPSKFYHKDNIIGYSHQFLMCLNIVEDIRIERLIRNKYIGLVNVFRIGYEALVKSGFFGDVSSEKNMSYADRVNIWSKCGSLTPVRMHSSRDYAAYKYIASAVTFDDSIDRAKFLMAYNKQDAIERYKGEPTYSDGAGEFEPGDAMSFDDLPDDVKASIEDIIQEASNVTTSEYEKVKGDDIKSEDTIKSNVKSHIDTKIHEARLATENYDINTADELFKGIKGFK